jgi:hypothetical protein
MVIGGIFFGRVFAGGEAYLQGVCDFHSVLFVVILWWVCGDVCPLGGSYNLDRLQGIFFLGFEIYFWGEDVRRVMRA